MNKRSENFFHHCNMIICMGNNRRFPADVVQSSILYKHTFLTDVRDRFHPSAGWKLCLWWWTCFFFLKEFLIKFRVQGGNQQQLRRRGCFLLVRVTSTEFLGLICCEIRLFGFGLFVPLILISFKCNLSINQLSF